MVEALLNIKCIAKGYNYLLYSLEVNVGEVFSANKKRGEHALKVVTTSWTTRLPTVRACGSSLATICRYFSVSVFFVKARYNHFLFFEVYRLAHGTNF